MLQYLLQETITANLAVFDPTEVDVTIKDLEVREAVFVTNHTHPSTNIMPVIAIISMVVAPFAETPRVLHL